MKNNIKKVVTASLAGVVLGTTLTVSAGTWIQAYRNDSIKVSLNGQTQIFKDELTGETQYPLTYNNRTYLPLRSLANLLGFNVEYDSATDTAILETSDYKNQTEIKTIKPTEILKDNFRKIYLKYTENAYNYDDEKYANDFEDLYKDVVWRSNYQYGENEDISIFDISEEDKSAIEEYTNKIYKKYADLPDTYIFDELGDGHAFEQLNLYTSSSMLKPYGNEYVFEASPISYSSQNLEKINYNNAWVEGKEGYGIGEKIQILAADVSEARLGDSPSPGGEIIGDLQSGFSYSDYVEKKYNVQGYNHTLNGILIINGYAKSEELYKANSRVKKLKLTIDDKQEYILELEDTMNPQLFDIDYTQELDKESLKPVKAEFEILEVYEGEKYDDTAITTIRMNVTRNKINR